MQLVEDVTSNKRKMKELEDNLLYRLTSTKVSTYLNILMLQISCKWTTKSSCELAALFTKPRDVLPAA